MPDEVLAGETARLRWAWDRHGAAQLDRYLVSGVEDPRINVPSILTRAWIADVLFPGEFEALVNEELRFGLCMTQLLERLAEGQTRGAVLAALERGDAGAGGGLVGDAFRRLREGDGPIPDYVAAALCDPLEADGQRLPASALDAFAWIWRAELATRSREPISVLEPACGSANEYRSLDACGLTRFIRYSGFDLSGKNVRNAQRRFPEVDFRVGNVLHIEAEDNAYDLVFVHDLFEHLSEEALGTALREILRVAKRQARLSYFNLADIPEHRFHDTGDYHWNSLSLPRIVAFISQLGPAVDVTRVGEFATGRFGCEGYYNPDATALVATV